MSTPWGTSSLLGPASRALGLPQVPPGVPKDGGVPGSAPAAIPTGLFGHHKEGGNPFGKSLSFVMC